MAGGERTVNKKALIMLLLALVAVVGQRRVEEWLWESGWLLVVVPWAVDKGGSACRMHIGLPPLAVAMWGKPDVFVVSGICLPALQYAVDGLGYQFHAFVVGVGEDELSLDGVGFAVYVIQGVTLFGAAFLPVEVSNPVDGHVSQAVPVCVVHDGRLLLHVSGTPGQKQSPAVMPHS